MEVLCRAEPWALFSVSGITAALQGTIVSISPNIAAGSTRAWPCPWRGHQCDCNKWFVLHATRRHLTLGDAVPASPQIGDHSVINLFAFVQLLALLLFRCILLGLPLRVSTSRVRLPMVGAFSVVIFAGGRDFDVIKCCLSYLWWVVAFHEKEASSESVGRVLGHLFCVWCGPAIVGVLC